MLHLLTRVSSLLDSLIPNLIISRKQIVQILTSTQLSTYTRGK